MKRFIVHLQNTGFDARNANELLLRARSLADDDVVIRDARVSSKFIEFDLSIASEKLKSLLEKVSMISPVASYTEINEKQVAKERAIELAKSLFNDERYWECHEVLEGVWKHSSGNEKELLQGIILTCAGFVHAQKDESDTCFSILNRSLAKLQNKSDMYYGINMDRFKQTIVDILSTKKIEYFKI
jgi:predicted metal-dependent hydrolase